MTIVSVRAETLPDCTGVVETPVVCMGLAEMPSVCMGVTETPSYCNAVTGTPPLTQKKQSGLMIMPEKETVEVVSLNLESVKMQPDIAV